MPPKAAPAAAASAANKGGNAKPKKPSKQADDEDDKLLAAQEATAKAAAKAMEEAKVIEDARKARAAKEEQVRQQVADLLSAKLPPILIDDIAEKLVGFVKTAKEFKAATNMNDMCWLSYILNNFMMLAVEKKRRIALRTPAAPEEGEAIVSFEVHDDKQPGDKHSWNVITTKSGTYVIDMPLEQFLPAGRYGYRRDAHPEEGWKAVKAPSRLFCGEATTPHAGVIAKDGGILPEGPVVVEMGVPAGTHKKYLRFLADAEGGRHKSMTPEERKAAETLVRSRMIPLWRVVQEFLESNFAPSPAPAAK